MFQRSKSLQTSALMPTQATTYIGLCRFERAYDENGNSITAAEGQILETFEAPIACWSTSAQQYDEMLTHLLPDQSYRLLRTEEVMPAQTWFEMKGFNQPLADLTAKVHNQHRFEIGHQGLTQIISTLEAGIKSTYLAVELSYIGRSQIVYQYITSFGMTITVR